MDQTNSQEPSCNHKEPLPEPTELNISHYFMFILLFVFLFASYKIIKPYLHTIIIALLLAIVFHPLHEWIVRKVGGRKNLGAVLSCVILTLVVLIPIMFLAVGVVRQGIASFHDISQWIKEGGLEKLLHSETVAKLTPYIDKYIPEVSLSEMKVDKALLDISSRIGTTLINQGGKFFGDLTNLVVKFFLMVFSFFFLVRDLNRIFDGILHLSPLTSTHEERIVFNVKSVAWSALLGTFITAVLQGIIGGIAFKICGLPALFWGMAISFTSLIPIVGAALIWFPATIYLVVSGSWGYGIFMALWSALIMGSVDNFIRPLFMRDSGDMNTFVIFFAVLGGISYFGVIGLLYGPLIIALTFVFLNIYSEQFKPFLDYQDKA